MTLGEPGKTAARLSEPHEPELDPPFDVLDPSALASPLVFSSPHSGSIYPRRFLEWAKLDATALRRSEDAFVDELFGGVTSLGIPFVRARFPRAYLDVNREPYELDPRMFEGRLPVFANTRSVRVAAGLGTIARVVGEAQEIYAARLPVDEAMHRIDKLYKPYHRSLRALLERAEKTFGIAVLVDCHSMPSSANAVLGTLADPLRRAPAPREKSVKADFVVGDRYGTSCAGFLVDAVEYELRRLGYAVMRNNPYAGGFITEHYGHPANHYHALQIEVNRALYMDEKTLSKGERFTAVTADLTKVAAVLADAVLPRRDERAAAE